MHQFAETKQFSLPSKQSICPFLYLCYLMQIVPLSSCVQIETRHLSLDTSKRQIILEVVMEPAGTSPWEPVLFRFPLEVQLGIRSIPYSKNDRQIWCDLNAAISLFLGHNGSVFTMALLLFAVPFAWLSARAICETSKYFGLFLWHIHHCTLRVQFSSPIYCLQFVFSRLRYSPSQEWAHLFSRQYLLFLP